jgi:hypothetical protein
MGEDPEKLKQRLPLLGFLRQQKMYRRQLGDEKARRKLHLYDRRLLAIVAELGRLSPTEK